MHYGRVPRERPGPWWLTFDGLVAQEPVTPVALTELVDLQQHTVVADMHCGSGWSAAGRHWRGWRTRDVVDRYPPGDGVTHALVFGEYGYSATVRIEDLLSPRSLLAVAVDGEALTPETGHPVRLVVPHLYSWKGPKWFRGWTYQSEPVRGFWEQRGYHVHGDPWRQERYAHLE